jgi:hypothetical protein
MAALYLDRLLLERPRPMPAQSQTWPQGSTPVGERPYWSAPELAEVLRWRGRQQRSLPQLLRAMPKLIGQADRWIGEPFSGQPRKRVKLFYVIDATRPYPDSPKQL